MVALSSVRLDFVSSSPTLGKKVQQKSQKYQGPTPWKSGSESLGHSKKYSLYFFKNHKHGKTLYYWQLSCCI